MLVDRCLIVCLAVFCSLNIRTGDAKSQTLKLGDGYGPLTGEFDLESGATRFLGVPYAQPPVGERRFSPPAELIPWSEEITCTAYKPACPQGKRADEDTTVTSSEDCLYLNIFVPGEIDSSKSLPVVVYIHDGMFQFGSVNGADAAASSVRDDVIVVTVSYRLGVLGFLGKGNYGLWDQNLALLWVKDNIEYFGGNANEVTLVGSGSGAFAVGLHIFANASSGLFKRAVSSGGSPFQTEYTVSSASADNAATTFSNSLSCLPNDSDCLRKVPLEQILESQRALSAQNEVRFSVTEDGQFLPLDVNKVKEHLTVADYVIGLHNDCGSEFIQDLLTDPSESFSEGNYRAALNAYIAGSYPLASRAVSELALFEYEEDELTPLRSLVNLRRDAIAGAVRHAQTHLANAGVNVYGFFADFHAESYHRSMTSPSTYPYYEGLLFGRAREGGVASGTVELWRSFVKTSSPAMVVDGKPVPWPKFDEASKHMLLLNNALGSDSVISQFPDGMEKHVPFWAETIRKMADTCKYCEEPSAPREGPVVTLAQGKVKGERITLPDNNYTYEFYQGIPFAKPPVGDLRFMSPQTHPGWEELIEPKQIPVACPQMNTMLVLMKEDYREDCLLLDVYVPQTAETNRDKKLPVMIFVHGGGFSTGSKNAYNGAGLTMYDVVVVTINYRLGVLGFLSTEDDVLPGNLGLMDQQFAFKWVKSNIETFGGDPDKVTIFGESAGAGSVAMQMLMPSSKGLFQNVIAQSGGSFLGQTLGYKHKESAIKIAKHFNCSSFNSFVVRECLRHIDPMKLSTIEGMPMEELFTLAVFPRVDGVVFPKSPDQLFQDGVARDYNFMTGSTEHEGYLFFIMLNDLFLTPDLADNTTLVGQAFAHVYKDVLDARARGGGANDTDFVKMATDLMTDFIITSHTDNDANLNSRNGGKTYRYMMRHRSGHENFLAAKVIHDFVNGIHGEDLLMVFGHPVVDQPNNRWFMSENFTWPERDVELSKQMMAAWANFAYTGDPNKGPTSFDYEWPEYTEATPNVFEFRKNLAQARGRDAVLNKNDHPEVFRPRAIKFWNEVYPVLHKEMMKARSCIKKAEDASDIGDQTGTSAEPVNVAPEKTSAAEEDPTSVRDEL